MSDLPDSARVDLARERDFVLGGAEVQPSSREIHFDGATETVEPRVMQVLVALARHRGKVVSRDALVHQCWEGRVVGDDAINRCLAKVRRLTERMLNVTLETVPRVGYRLSEESVPARVKRETPSRRTMLVAAGITLLLLLLGAVGYAVVRQQDHTPLRFAVLPFGSLNSGEEMHLFGKSIAAATAVAMDRAGLLLVSTAPIPARAENNPADVGRALGADYVVTGSVRQEGAVIRVFARVEQVQGATTVYMRVFEVPASRKPALPDLVAKEIAGALTSNVAACRRGSRGGDEGCATIPEHARSAPTMLREISPAAR